MELLQHTFYGLHISCCISWFRARQGQPLVLRVTLEVRPVSRLGQSGFTNALFDNDRGRGCDLVYQTQEEAARFIDFYPLDFKEQISKKANHAVV